MKPSIFWLVLWLILLTMHVRLAVLELDRGASIATLIARGVFITICLVFLHRRVWLLCRRDAS